MAKVTGIDHLVLRVGNFKRSKKFYDDLLGFLGFKSIGNYPDAAGWHNGLTGLWIQAAEGSGEKRLHKTGDIGFHHYAFKLAWRKQVDELYKFLKKRKIKVVDAPAEYPEYGGKYYAVFFLDPDGMKLEGMHCLPK